MLKIGITGGKGSGKSTAAFVFSYLGIPIYNSDDRAKFLMRNDNALKIKIVDLFGSEAYLRTGEINSELISSCVFKDDKLLQKLNGIVHPAVAEDFILFCKKNENAPFILKEAAILIESKAYLNLDKIIVVTAPVETRITRVMQRNSWTREQVLSRMSNQLPEEELLKFAHFEIQNDGQESLVYQVLGIFMELIHS